ncbi:MAG: citrate lyase acyl carrier protein [Succiniclasticum sp.]|uniref:citrate lyase acyl carrier protein n=1 Tax=Succiniclasticum sp. TaxID=2775030 RepID=UPI002A90E1C3|nr:citrate lyase acyl carrier protein [Succiniclasticum sp.]MDY6290503.1 citrate lyase acyl carrier protein [Succiniclasticum sp.]
MEFTDKAVTCGTDKKGDLLVTLELSGTGRDIDIHSKVEKKFGEAIQEDVLAMLDAYAIKDVKVRIEDLGALDFAIKARVETAIRRALAREEK